MTTAKSAETPRAIQAWEQNLLGLRWIESPRLLPGLLLATALAWGSIQLSDFIGVDLMGFASSPVSPVIIAIVLGLVIGNVLPLPALFEAGLAFSVKKVLRLGIILLGIRLSVMDVFRLGAMGVPIILLCIAGALLLTTALNRWLKLPERLGTLIAVGTSICGVTAIVAASPAIDAEDEEVSYAVAVITLFGIIATLTYPFLAHWLFGGNAVQAGLFLGTSIHETAQVAGAGLVYADIFANPLALDTATIAKMVRNVFMALVIPLMALIYVRRSASNNENAGKTSIRKLFPLFILGFLAMAVVRSIGDVGIGSGSLAFGLWDRAVWADIVGTSKEWAVIAMVVALAGVGLNTRLNILKDLGVKPFLVGLAAAIIVGGISFLTISLLGTLVAL